MIGGARLAGRLAGSLPRLILIDKSSGHRPPTAFSSIGPLAWPSAAAQSRNAPSDSGVALTATKVRVVAFGTPTRNLRSAEGPPISISRSTTSVAFGVRMESGRNPAKVASWTRFRLTASAAGPEEAPRAGEYSVRVVRRSAPASSPLKIGQKLNGSDSTPICTSTSHHRFEPARTGPNMNSAFFLSSLFLKRRKTLSDERARVCRYAATFSLIDRTDDAGVRIREVLFSNSISTAIANKGFQQWRGALNSAPQSVHMSAYFRTTGECVISDPWG